MTGKEDLRTNAGLSKATDRFQRLQLRQLFALPELLYSPKNYESLRFVFRESCIVFTKSDLRKIISEKIFTRSEEIFRKSDLFSSKFRRKNSEREALLQHLPFDTQIYDILTRNPNRVNSH